MHFFLLPKLRWQNPKLKLRKNPIFVYCFGSDWNEGKVQLEEVCSGLLDHVRGKRRLKGERGLKVMVGLWLLAFDGVGSGDEERLQFKK
jgi:hypothetical protein